MSEPFSTILGERLYAECTADVRLSEILVVLRQCRDDLDVGPADALPELLERLARARLQLIPPAPAALAVQHGPAQHP